MLQRNETRGRRSIRQTPSLPPRFSPLTLAFADRRLELLFVVENNRRAVWPIRGLAIIYITVMSILTVFDVVVGSLGIEAQLPWRIGGIFAVLGAVWLTGWSKAVRLGQPLFAMFLVALHVGFYLSVQYYPDYVLTAVPAFLMTLAMTLVLPALLFRYAMPIAAVAMVGYAERLVTFMPGLTYVVPVFFLVASTVVLAYGAYASERGRRTAWAGARALAREKARSEALLLNVLPPSIAERMSAGERLIADTHEAATILFADIVGFTPLSRTMDPAALVALLDEVFTEFDAIADRYDLEKIKTIGDAYMLAAGTPAERPIEPQRVCLAALDMRRALAAIVEERGAPLEMRVGIHCGPVVAGVIGQRKFIYDIWGDTVNTASRMESTAPPGEIQMTEAVASRLSGLFAITPRGTIEVRGLGPMAVFLLGEPLAGAEPT